MPARFVQVPNAHKSGWARENFFFLVFLTTLMSGCARFTSRIIAVTVSTRLFETAASVEGWLLLLSLSIT